MKPPSFQRITLRPGRILWHARWQPVTGARRNVMNSPDYLYTSPQISQAILHGFSTRKKGTVVELTKLRVKKTITLINFKTPSDQIKFATYHGLSNFRVFSQNDTKLFKFMCEDHEIDGYRAHWDQDQIALCSKVIRDKLEKVSSTNYTDTFMQYGFGININKINFVPSKRKNASYYQTANKRHGKKLTKVLKGTLRV